MSTTQDFSANSQITGATSGVFIGGGTSHSVAGSYNVIAGGDDNTVSGHYPAVPGGENGNDRGIHGKLCFQSGADISSVGDHQVCWQTLSGSLSGAGSVEMLTGSDQSTASASNTLALPANKLSYGFSCEVDAVNTSNGDAGQFYVDHALISRAAGASSVTVDGATSPLALAHGALIGTLASAGVAVTAAPDTTVGGLDLTAAETGALPLHFAATCETREVQIS